jgi:choline dehydrogenase
MNAAFTYLAPARQRPNLTLIADALVDRVCLEGGRVTGVRTADGWEVRGQEVVLCAGAYGSPAILLRSGIGPAADMSALDIPVIADRPGVGAHLLDHPLLLFAAEDDGASVSGAPVVGGQAEGAAACAYVVRPEDAPATPTTIPLLLKARSRQATEEIDLYLTYFYEHDAARGRWGAVFVVCLEWARSTGWVRLTSPDPAATLAIDHAYLADPADLEALCDGAELAARLLATPPRSSVLAPVPGVVPRWHGRDDLRTWVGEHVATTFHPSSTCRMGPAADPGTVVDHVGRVYGVAGLRVADAAIFPSGPRANLHCTVVVVAEKLADAIRHDVPA